MDERGIAFLAQQTDYIRLSYTDGVKAFEAGLPIDHVSFAFNVQTYFWQQGWLNAEYWANERAHN